MVSGVDPSALRAAREKAGLTQHELARLVGAAGGERVSRWELGTSVPRPDFLVKLARALDIPSPASDPPRGEVPDLRALRLQAGLTVPSCGPARTCPLPTYYSWEQALDPPAGPPTLEASGTRLGEPADVVAAAFNEAAAPRAGAAASARTTGTASSRLPRTVEPLIDTGQNRAGQKPDVCGPMARRSARVDAQFHRGSGPRPLRQRTRAMTSRIPPPVENHIR